MSQLNKGLNVCSAAFEVLKQANKPLTAKEITRQILAKQLWFTQGKTPDATVSASLYLDIKKNGAKSLFIKVAPMTFSLSEHALHSISHSVKAIEEQPIIQTLSFTDCAEKILKTLANKTPMHYREITERALAAGWLVTQGKTPEATMYAQILTEITRQQKRGLVPRFTKQGLGYVGLSEWMGEGLIQQINEHNQQIRKKLLKRLLSISPANFEQLVTLLLIKMDFQDVVTTKISNDGGIDVRGTMFIGDAVPVKLAIQVKRWKNNVQAPTVQQVRGSLAIHEQGLIITTSNFSKGAIEEAKRIDKTPIALMTGEEFVALLFNYEVGVIHSPQNLFEIDNDFKLFAVES